LLVIKIEAKVVEFSHGV